MDHAFTIPLAVMSLLSVGGFVAVLAYAMIRAALLRRALAVASQRRADEAASMAGLREVVEAKRRAAAERRLQRQRQHERLEGARRALAAARQDRLEFVHELSEPGPRDRLFRIELTPERAGPKHGGPERRAEDAVFSPEIWRRRNVAEVWARGPEQAAEVAAKAFPPGTGILRGPARPAGGEPAAGAEAKAAEAEAVP